jgi:hypothetical protein
VPSAPRKGFPARALSSLLDCLLGLALGLLLADHIGFFFAERAVVMLRIDEPGTLWQGPVPMFLGILGPLVYLLPAVFLLVLLPEALYSASPGKLALRMRVRGEKGASAPAGRRWLRWGIKTAGLWGMTLALITGRWELAAASVIAGALVLAGSLTALGPSRQALHDRLSETAVYRS